MEVSANMLLKALIDEFQNWRFQEFPEHATVSGLHVYNYQLGTLTLDKFTEHKMKCEAILAQLHSIGKERLDSLDQANYELFEDYLQTYIEGYKWRYHSACNPVNFLENIHSSFSNFLISATPFSDHKDFLNYFQRLQCIPTQISEQIVLMKEAISHKTTLHRSSVEAVPVQISEILEKSIEQNPFYEPCSKYKELIAKNRDRQQ